MFTLSVCRPVRVSGQRCLHCVNAAQLGLKGLRCLHCGCRPVRVRGHSDLDCVNAALLGLRRDERNRNS